MHRFLISAALAANAFAQQPTPPQPASLAGSVVNLEGRAISRAMVRLVGPKVYTQFADADGKFAIENVSPGAYALVAMRKGYAAQKYKAPAPLIQDCEYAEQLAEAGPDSITLLNLKRCMMGAPGAVLTLTAGQEMKDLVIRLTRQGTITGRVMNQDGDPVAGWSVRLMQMAFTRGARELQSRASSSTDIDGNFAFADVTPGRYYLYALDFYANAFGDLLSERHGKGPPEADLPTYFPGSADTAHATPVDVKPGAELTGVDIHLRRDRVYSIRGKLSAPADSGVASQILRLTRAGAPAGYQDEKSARVYADGSFEFRNLPPGDYVVTGGQAWGNAGTAAPMYARAEVTVSGADVEGLTLTMVPTIELSARARLEGGKSGNWPTIQLQRTDGDAGTLAEADPSGVYQFRSRVAPILYIVEFLHPPDGTYVKSARFGDQDLLHTPLDLTHAGGGRIELVLSANVAAIAGSVKTGGGDSVPGMVVTAWPKKPRVSGGIKSASTDQNGHFEIADLGPEDYFVAAWESIDSNLAQAPDFLARFQPAATEVTLEEGSRATADLTLISKDRVASEIAKLNYL